MKQWRLHLKFTDASSLFIVRRTFDFSCLSRSVLRACTLDRSFSSSVVNSATCCVSSVWTFRNCSSSSNTELLSFTTQTRENHLQNCISQLHACNKSLGPYKEIPTRQKFDTQIQVKFYCWIYVALFPIGFRPRLFELQQNIRKILTFSLR